MIMSENVEVDLDIEYEKNSIPLGELIPKGMTIKEYFGKEQRLLRGESISYMNFDQIEWKAQIKEQIKQEKT